MFGAPFDLPRSCPSVLAPNIACAFKGAFPGISERDYWSRGLSAFRATKQRRYRLSNVRSELHAVIEVARHSTTAHMGASLSPDCQSGHFTIVESRSGSPVGL